MTMRFYSGVVDDVNHHDIALVEQKDLLPEPPAEWSMYQSTLAINHIAITYPDRESWLEEVQFLKDNGVKMNLRVDHGMTHSVYINDPNGYGVEVLYDLPEEVWMHDIDGALNYGVQLPEDQLLVDDTNYTTDFTRRPSSARPAAAASSPPAVLTRDVADRRAGEAVPRRGAPSRR